MPTTFRQIQDNYSKLLKAIYPEEEAAEIIARLIEYHTGFSRAQYLLHKDEAASDTFINKISKDAELLLQCTPFQYVIGETEFYGCKLKVTPAVLIPRPETEELVDLIVRVWKEKQPNIIEFGTGSGCISIALKKSIDNSKVTTVDISEEAIALAKENAVYNNTPITFINQDMRAFETSDRFDIIVSNPPYVMESEKKEMRDNVLKHEPHLALFVSDSNPLEFYESIAKIAEQSLANSGIIYLEINQQLGKETLNMLSQYGFMGEVRRDFFGVDRYIEARWK